MVCEGDSLTGLGEAVVFITSELLWTGDDRCSGTQSIHVWRSSGLPVGFIKYTPNSPSARGVVWLT